MKPIRFHPDAESEMTEAAKYYDAFQRGLGRRFLVCVRDAINRIRINPFLYPILDYGVRRCLIQTFPYGVLYRNAGEQTEIVAVMHLKRDLDYWKKR